MTDHLADDSEDHRFERGTQIVLRYFVQRRDSRPLDYLQGSVIVRDDETEIVVATPGGSAKRNRVGRRADPNRRQLITGEWFGDYADGTWEPPAAVKVHRPGQSWSVWRWWDGSTWSSDLYINLEDPWTRTHDGFDTGDWVLDVIASDEDGTWRVRMKDEDELAVLVSLGEISDERADMIRRSGAELAHVARERPAIFTEGWDTRIPDPAWGPAPLPTL